MSYHCDSDNDVFGKRMNKSKGSYNYEEQKCLHAASILLFKTHKRDDDETKIYAGTPRLGIIIVSFFLLPPAVSAVGPTSP